MKRIGIMLLAFIPIIALANDNAPEDVQGILTVVGILFDRVFYLIIAAASIAFAWGLMLFIFRGDGDKEKAKGLIVWSITALFVMVSVWGIIAILQNTFGISPADGLKNVPNLPTSINDSEQQQ